MPLKVNSNRSRKSRRYFISKDYKETRLYFVAFSDFIVFKGKKRQVFCWLKKAALITKTMTALDSGAVGGCNTI